MSKTNLCLSLVAILSLQACCLSMASETKNDKEARGEKTVKIGGIDWYVDYDAALKIAKAKNLPLWLHFGENPG